MTGISRLQPELDEQQHPLSWLKTHSKGGGKERAKLELPKPVQAGWEVFASISQLMASWKIKPEQQLQGSKQSSHGGWEGSWHSVPNFVILLNELFQTVDYIY